MPARKHLNRTGKPVPAGRSWQSGVKYASASRNHYLAAAASAISYESQGYEVKVCLRAPVKRPHFAVKYRMIVDGTHKQFEYTGESEKLIGQTALGKFDSDGSFAVQVDKFDHEWSHKWHKTPICDWKPRV